MFFRKQYCKHDPQAGALRIVLDLGVGLGKIIVLDGLLDPEIDPLQLDRQYGRVVLDHDP